MKDVRPVYIKALVVAIAIYVIGMAFAVSDLYLKVGDVEHRLMHMSSGHMPHK